MRAHHGWGWGGWFGMDGAIDPELPWMNWVFGGWGSVRVQVVKLDVDRFIVAETTRIVRKKNNAEQSCCHRCMGKMILENGVEECDYQIGKASCLRGPRDAETSFIFHLTVKTLRQSMWIRVPQMAVSVSPSRIIDTKKATVDMTRSSTD